LTTTNVAPNRNAAATRARMARVCRVTGSERRRSG
jgi:hypothetical protein